MTVEIKKDPLLVEKIILQLIFKNEKVRDVLLPYLDQKIFYRTEAKFIVGKFLRFIEEFNAPPKANDFRLSLTNEENLKYFNEVFDIKTEEFTNEHLLFVIEDHIKRNLITNEMAEAYEKIQNSEFDLDKLSSFPEMVSEALSFSFDNDIGTEAFSDRGFEDFYDYLQSSDEVISTGLPDIDKIIGGGFHRKTLNVIAGAPGRGKTLTMCSLASNNILDHKKVLYITLEMSEKKIKERIVSNIMDLDINGLSAIPKKTFKKLYENYIEKYKESIFIKEYAPNSVNANNIRRLLKELRDKRKFVPDIIYVDYLTIMKSTKKYSGDNSFGEHKTTSEDLRGIGVDYDLPVVTGSQIKREGADKTVVSISDISESFGIPMTADLIIGVTQNDDLKALRRFIWSAIKNRYGINNLYTQVGVVYDRMRITPTDDDIHIIGEVDQIEEMTGLKTGVNSNINTMDEEVEKEIDDGSSFLSKRIQENSKEKTKRLSGLDFE